MRQIEGVFLLRFQGNRKDGGEVDHVVVVDAAKKVIWDGVSERVIRLELSAIDFLVVDDVYLVGVKG